MGCGDEYDGTIARDVKCASGPNLPEEYVDDCSPQQESGVVSQVGRVVAGHDGERKDVKEVVSGLEGHEGESGEIQNGHDSAEGVSGRA